jgi:hypothetical protein
MDKATHRAVGRAGKAEGASRPDSEVGERTEEAGKSCSARGRPRELPSVGITATQDCDPSGWLYRALPERSSFLCTYRGLVSPSN